MTLFNLSIIFKSPVNCPCKLLQTNAQGTPQKTQTVTVSQQPQTQTTIIQPAQAHTGQQFIVTSEYSIIHSSDICVKSAGIDPNEAVIHKIYVTINNIDKVYVMIITSYV